MKSLKYIWNRPWLFMLCCLAFPFGVVGLSAILQIVAYLCASAWIGIFNLCITFNEWIVQAIHGLLAL